jgi:hypothetical protein
MEPSVENNALKESGFSKLFWLREDPLTYRSGFWNNKDGIYIYSVSRENTP